MDFPLDTSRDDHRPAEGTDLPDVPADDPAVSPCGRATSPSSCDTLGIDGEDLGGGAGGRGGYPTGFGRGWIPVEREIGLPAEGDEFLPGMGRGPIADGGGVRAGLPDSAGASDSRHVPLHHPAPKAQFILSACKAVEGDGPPLRSEENPGRTPRARDFTPQRRAEFLHHLAIDGNVRLAAARVRVSTQAAYLARRRDPAFRAGWAASQIHAREHAEQVLANLAIEGQREAVWHRGEVVGEKVKIDARLLLAHLGRLDARCEDAQAHAHAERFDELLALVAGARFPAAMADRPAGRHDAADPILPMERDRYVVEGGFAQDDAAEDRIDPRQVERDAAMWAAQDRADAQWGGWRDVVDAVNDALDAGEEPVVPVMEEKDEEEEPEGEILPRPGEDLSLRTVSTVSTSPGEGASPSDHPKPVEGRGEGEPGNHSEEIAVPTLGEEAEDLPPQSDEPVPSVEEAVEGPEPAAALPDCPDPSPDNGSVLPVYERGPGGILVRCGPETEMGPASLPAPLAPFRIPDDGRCSPWP